jgi:hypothetical protein
MPKIIEDILTAWAAFRAARARRAGFRAFQKRNRILRVRA